MISARRGEESSRLMSHPDPRNLRQIHAADKMLNETAGKRARNFVFFLVSQKKKKNSTPELLETSENCSWLSSTFEEV